MTRYGSVVIGLKFIDAKINGRLAPTVRIPANSTTRRAANGRRRVAKAA